jgi:deoxyribodipyrimidine photo-lyase
MASTALVWFRLDLRLSDNPALTVASAHCDHIVPVFIWAPEEEGDWPPGAASRWWLQQSLKSLDADLRRIEMRLILRRGPSLDALRSLVRECSANSIFWNRRYEPALRERDTRVEQALRSDGLHVETFNSSLLFEPEEIKNRSGKPYRIFTPFWRSCLSAAPDFAPLPAPLLRKIKSLKSPALDELKLEPALAWAEELRSSWQPGESGARKLLQQFLADALEDYPKGRDYPAISGTSRLSPHLHFGEISPRQVWVACAGRGSVASKAFVRQLGWREFAHQLLYYFPDTTSKPLRPEFSHLRWLNNRQVLRAWQQGRTGYPMVDAGMRQLQATGWMHNRMRMVAGSFLVKDLLMHWQEGARWFWDMLVDADLANNTLGWQWISGCGADAAPFYRIFNPTTQAAKFDPKGEYIGYWVPERGTPDYPRQVVNHARARERALDALAAIKGKE